MVLVRAQVALLQQALAQLPLLALGPVAQLRLWPQALLQTPLLPQLLAARWQSLGQLVAQWRQVQVQVRAPVALMASCSEAPGSCSRASKCWLRSM